MNAIGKALLLACACAAAMPGAWKEYRSGPFVVYSEAGDQEVYAALYHLEQFRYVLGSSFGKPEPRSTWPVTIVVERGRRAPAAPHFGFSRDGWMGLWPAQSPPGPDFFAALGRVFLEDNLTAPMPEGMEEALLSLYSTLQVQKGRLVFGLPPPEARRTPQWALLHMLATREEMATRYQVLVSNLAAGNDPVPSFRNAFGRRPEEFETEAAAYLKAGQFAAVTISGRTLHERMYKELPAMPSRVRLLAGDLALARGDAAAARAAYTAALNERASAAGHEGLGLALLAAGDRAQAKSELEAATSEEGAGPRAWFELSRLESDAEKARKLLESAVKLNPGWAEPYVRLAELEPGPARKTYHLKKAAELAPRRPAIWLALAQAQFDAKEFAASEKSWNAAMRAAPGAAEKERLRKEFEAFQQARLDAQEAERRRRQQEERDELERLRKEALQRIREAETRANEAAGGRASGQKVEQWWEGPKLETVSGVLQQVDCLGKRARLVLLTDAKTAVRLLIPDPSNVLITGGGEASLSCGPQRPPKRVRIEYAPRPDKAAGTAGDAASVEFLK
jgi:hypothetical protein